MTIYVYAYIYTYNGDEVQGGGIDMYAYLSLTSSPGIYYKYYDNNEKWSVLEITDYGTFNTLHEKIVPKEVKIHHLLTK